MKISHTAILFGPRLIKAQRFQSSIADDEELVKRPSLESRYPARVLNRESSRTMKFHFDRTNGTR